MFGENALGECASPAWGGGEAADGEDRLPAFTDMVREHDAVLRGLARRLCGNSADADDLVHDAYERALRAWGRYVDQGNLRSWLVAILHNLFLDRCRKHKRAPRNEQLEQHDVVASEPVPPPRWAQVSNDAVTEALAELGPEFRRVYDLHAQGRSYDEIAAMLGIARATVGTRLLRARRQLKAALLRELGDQA
jgi:RNA polymerase sigma-70 factor (ECF subfamily)